MSRDRLPPGQELAAPGKWPIVGERHPASNHRAPALEICGEVSKPRSWSLDELRSLPQVTRTIDIHCVTRWSLLGARFTGVLLRDLLQEVTPLPTAHFLSFVANSERGHSSSLSLADSLALDVLIALQFEDRPLPEEHGGPIRSICPERYFYKSVKWLARIEALKEDRLGFWESTAGYHNHADPWLEQRFIASGVKKQDAIRILAGRDLTGRDLLGLDASHHDLRNLRAAEARLRNANFRGTRLDNACFDRANLSNAQFQGASLRGVSFRDADLEGASFAGSDLRGADLRGASLFGTQFVTPQGSRNEEIAEAVLDASTLIDPAAIESLTPQQAAFINRCLGRGY